MTDRSAHAPLFVDAMALCEWLDGHFGTSERLAERRMLGHALDLLETLTLALKDRQRERRIEEADELLIRLRAGLRLAVECGRFDPDRYHYVLGQVDGIGRQLGAWRRSLGPV
jgi:hypothetical protein